MAEGCSAESWGDEGEKPEVKVPEALAGADAFAAAVAARLYAHDSEVARKTADFSNRSVSPAEGQFEHLGDEYWRWTRPRHPFPQLVPLWRA